MKKAKAGQKETQTDARRRAIEALLSGENREGAALAADVSVRTIGRWLADPAFAAELEAARTLAFAEALNCLKGGAALAVRTLLQNLKARTPAERRQAAKEILTFAFKGIEVADFEARLAILEAYIEERHPGHGRVN